MAYISITLEYWCDLTINTILEEHRLHSFDALITKQKSSKQANKTQNYPDFLPFFSYSLIFFFIRFDRKDGGLEKILEQ